MPESKNSSDFNFFALPTELHEILVACPGYVVARSVEQLVSLAVRDAGPDGWHEVAYEVPGRGQVVEAHACKSDERGGRQLR
jgi:hypothetical protein